MRAGSVSCSNNGADLSAIQNAVNNGGTVTLSGTCAVAGSAVQVNNSVTLNGTATLNGNGDIAFVINSDNVSISGLTFVSTGIYIPGANNAKRSNIVITNNTFRDFTLQSQPSGIGSDMILESSHISGNTFRNFWIGGYSNTTTNPDDNNQSAVGIQIAGGLDNTDITWNVFDQMENDALHVFWQGMIGNTNGFTGQNVSISYNTFTRVHRIAVELQGTGSWPNGCPGGCTGRPAVASLAVKGNYLHLPAWPYWNTYAYSLVEGGTGSNDLFLNNTAIAEPGSGTGGPAYGIETPCCATGQRIQGSVIASGLPNNWGWGADIQTYSPGSSTNQDVNNVLCGSPTGPNKIASNGAYTALANLVADTCPAGVTTPSSSIVAAFTTPNNQTFSSGGNGTWSLALVSNLSVRYVQFFLDNGTTPVATQELQDVNNNFTNDRKWLYHATVNTSTLSGGSHTLSAKITDVSGASQTISQAFFAGGGAGAPTAQFTPGSLSFGTQTVGLKTASQSLTLKNSGTSALVISGISVTGANSKDFGSISTCAGSLAPGTSCTIAVTFTPSIAQAETASITVSDNAAGSPLSASLTGSGAAPSTPPPPPSNPPPTTTPTLAANLPTGMILWLANDAGLTTASNKVSAWQDQSGNGNDAIQTTAANQPQVVTGNNQQNALRFDGVSSFMSVPSLPIDGLSGMTVFLVSANSKDLSAGYGNYSFLNWPETGPWGETFFGSYQTSAHFRFGTLQTGNENSYQMPFTRTDSFSLSEWMHAGTTDTMYLNTQTVASFAGKTQTIAGVGASALLGKGNNTFYQGDVSEVIIYNRALSTSERQQVEHYLMTKYHL